MCCFVLGFLTSLVFTVGNRLLFASASHLYDRCSLLFVAGNDRMLQLQIPSCRPAQTPPLHVVSRRPRIAQQRKRSHSDASTPESEASPAVAGCCAGGGAETGPPAQRVCAAGRGVCCLPELRDGVRRSALARLAQQPTQADMLVLLELFFRRPSAGTPGALLSPIPLDGLPSPSAWAVPQRVGACGCGPLCFCLPCQCDTDGSAPL
jgi:hypothetical protein